MRDDPVAPGLIEFLHRFIPEETGHDEWLIEDLEVLGVSRQDVLAHTPPPAIAALVGAQHYWIAHHHPVSVLGLFFVMETGSPRLDQIEDLICRTGLPRTAFRTFLRHAALDLKHGGDVEHVIDTLPFTSAHRSMIGVSLAHTTQYLALSTERSPTCTRSGRAGRFSSTEHPSGGRRDRPPEVPIPKLPQRSL